MNTYAMIRILLVLLIFLQLAQVNGKDCQSEILVVNSEQPTIILATGEGSTTHTTYYFETPSSGSLQLKWRIWGMECFGENIYVIKNSNELTWNYFVWGSPDGYNYYTFPGDGHYLVRTDGLGNNTIAVVVGTAPSITLDAYLILGGAYDPTTELMRDDLRAGNYLPLYYGTNSTIDPLADIPLSQSVLAVTGPEAVVDWIRLYLTNNYGITYATTALLKRNGRITSRDGISAVQLPAESGTYRIHFQHRNHLQIVTTLIQLEENGTNVIDLTVPNAPVYGTNALMPLGDQFGLWPGDTRQDGNVRYTNSYNDRDPILQKIGGSIATNVALGYEGADVNLDGVVKYTGANNDRDIILQTIGGSVPTATRPAQYPPLTP